MITLSRADFHEEVFQSGEVSSFNHFLETQKTRNFSKKNAQIPNVPVFYFVLALFNQHSWHLISSFISLISLSLAISQVWFVNFYSAYCSHCHLLAPIWREFAKQVPEGVARIGAVNCAEDPGLCQSNRIQGYPSLVLYPHVEFYQGSD